jgi:RNA polymerase sigma factor (sigma-70 family)
VDRFVQPVLDHLFRHEYGKLVSILTKTFGTQNLAFAEDAVQETLLKAMEQWKLAGIPDNPSAWLLTVARNKALDVLRRNRHHQEYIHNLSPLLKSEYTTETTLRELVTEQRLEDGQLRMMFVCCHPHINEDAQVALILKTLCGFSIAEIASAFLTNEENINKRLHRARAILREEKIAFELPTGDALQARLENVRTAIYLLFNEGYHASHQASIIRDDLVEEALRLGHMLVSYPATNQPATSGLLALMCFHAARLYGRTDKLGNILQLKDQDRSGWNPALIAIGRDYLTQASVGDTMTAYHIEAAISYEYCIAPTYDQTNWQHIDELYAMLQPHKPSAFVLLQHAIVKGERLGARAGLEAIQALEEAPELANNALVFAAKAEWFLQLNKIEEAVRWYQRAIDCSPSKAGKNFWKQKIANATSVGD